MGIDWYDMIARRNGGYRSNAVFTVEGEYAETIYEEELMKLLPACKSVLDAGCGHGDFTLRMSKHAKSIIGFDNSIEMINIAKSLLKESQVPNVRFVYASTKQELPFADEQFDLIYDRRGPTSILNHSRILRSGGVVFGIHSGAMETVKERLIKNHFTNVEITEYKNAVCYFPDENEFAKFISGIPGNPDYTLEEMRGELEKKLAESRINGRIGLRDYKYIWKAIKK